MSANMSMMIKIYVQLIEAGRRTIEEVPEAIRAEVQAAIGATSE